MIIKGEEKHLFFERTSASEKKPSWPLVGGVSSNAVSSLAFLCSLIGRTMNTVSSVAKMKKGK